MVIAVCDSRMLKTSTDSSMSDANILSLIFRFPHPRGWGERTPWSAATPPILAEPGTGAQRRAPAKPGGSSGGTPLDLIDLLQLYQRAEELSEFPPPPRIGDIPSFPWFLQSSMMRCLRYSASDIPRVAAIALIASLPPLPQRNMIWSYAFALYRSLTSDDVVVFDLRM